MTIDEKINAAEEYLEWREEANAFSSLRDGLEQWRSALAAQQLAETVQALRRAAEGAEFDAKEALEQMRQILEAAE